MALAVAFSAIFDARAAVSDAFASQNFKAPTQPEYGEILQREWSNEPDWDRCSWESGWRLGRFVRSDPRRIASRARAAWEAYELTGNGRYARTSKDLITRLGTL